jgi:hypothetical protein
MRASAYCRLGALGIYEPLAAIREIERNAARTIPAPTRAWYGFYPAPTFHYYNPETKPFATTTAQNGTRNAIVFGDMLGNNALFLASTRTPNIKSSGRDLT